ncbi:50S ribosomal protein L24 [Trueperella pecoris]|uniref:Large ribosomal subunit protein uL24 n=1 Tax=Trueperella pecoris TaxID=2733571 RepID=A0A7M1QVF3_9ACTO|nr:50S ribosomal protein L24 [Trueperella pecoris]QOQ38374.1 50S ribosomal protein L24 [Trueperella pecoris]QOR45137.1 50S ribosomal protein L24 [Trueperella pecoris]QOR47183.1 50S ribosomal protein L24 [Trueperella pecoris]QTG75043.1 50S ribosomal protein L24 [Trueperella pecoris]
MAKIKKGDLVQVIAGRDKGMQGRILEVLGDRVIVEGVQRVKKHTRVGRTDRGAATGGIETVEAPIHVSNVMLVGPDKKPVRVGFREVEVERDGRKKIMRERIGRRAGEEIEL